VLRSRFELFTAVSFALHAGVVVGMTYKHRPPPPAENAAYAGASNQGSGPAAAAGETFEVPDFQEPATESPPAPENAEPDEGETIPAPALAPASPAPDAPGPRASPRAHAHGGTRVAPAPPPSPPPLFGAVGDRSAGDLAASFKQTFGGGGDPLWDTVPVGFYANAEVTFELSPEGTLTQWSVATEAPVFRKAIERTVQLLKHRTFTARGATTRLKMVVRVSDHLVNAGAFTVAANGWFERGGRHVAVTISER
jgi:hypothetical protein